MTSESFRPVPVRLGERLVAALPRCRNALFLSGIAATGDMPLLGDWNWWVSRPVKVLVERIGLSHTEPAKMAVSPTVSGCVYCDYAAGLCWMMIHPAGQP
jgi:hypothetical protein